MMAGESFKTRLRYRFDNFMARGGSSIFISLVIVFTVSMIMLAIFRGVVGEFPDQLGLSEHELQDADRNLFHHLYMVFIQLSDPGTMSYDIESSPWFKVTAVLSGMIGLVILSALIAFITTALTEKISDLKKGHSKVIEKDHTLILGWNERVIEILRELSLANESEDDACVVILAKRDKEEMDDYLKVNMRDPTNTRIVTRSGTESSLVNLEIVSVPTCKSVIVLAGCNINAADGEKSVSDTMVIKTILALIASRPEDVKLNIVAEIFHERNRELLENISPEEVTTLDANAILSKLLVQTSRSVGLSVVYGEILSFDGCEMYFHNADWGAISFGEIGLRFRDGVPMGVRHRDGSLHVNPPLDMQMAPDDDILILAEDDSTIEFMSEPVAKPRDMKIIDKRVDPIIERELIIGWTPKVETILKEYADYTLDGSSVDIMLRAPDAAVRGEIKRIDSELEGLDVRLLEEDPLRREGLIAVEPFQYDNIIILSQSGEATGTHVDHDERTDSETIVILLMLRNIFEQYPEESASTKLITEVLDSDNQELVARTGVRDFIISNRYVSMLLSQISEDPDIKRVYDDLFEEDGSEIYLKPMNLYLDEFPADLTFAEVMVLAQKRGEVSLGVKIKKLEDDMSKNFGVHLIPEKNTQFSFTAEDSIVVIAEDDT